MLQSIPGLKLTAQFTHYAGHAKEMCTGLRRADYDLVIAVGGDGTVNEVINGLLGPADKAPAAEQIPALAVIPTGSANVFVRALGFPPEPVEATEALVNTIRNDLRRNIDVGTWDNKWFAVNVGFGLDADVISQMERARQRGFSATPLRYIRLTTRAWRRAHRRPPSISVSAVDSSGNSVTVSKLPICFASNTNPWTFFGPLPVVTNPRNSFDVGLGIFGLTSLDGVAGIVTMLQMLGANLPAATQRWLDKRVFVFDDAIEAQLTCTEPQAFQVDGEFAGEMDTVKLGAVANALEVFAPTETIQPTPLSWIRLGLSFFDLRL